MGRTVTIWFKDNKVSKVSGPKSQQGEAALFGQSFVEALHRGSPTIEAQDVGEAMKKLTRPSPDGPTEPATPTASAPKRRRARRPTSDAR